MHLPPVLAATLLRSSATAPGFARLVPYFPLLIFGSVASLFARFLLVWKRRRRDLAQLAAQRQFVLWPEDTPPPGLRLEDTPLARYSSIFNHYEGMHAGANVCHFDVVIGGGKNAYRRSALAVLAPGDALGWDAAVPGLSVYRLPNWVVFTRKPLNLKENLANFGMIPVPDIAAALDAISAHLDRLRAGAR